MTSSATVLLSAASELGGRCAGAVEGLAVLSAPLSCAAALMRDFRLSETAFVNTAGEKNDIVPENKTSIPHQNRQ